MNIDVQPVLIDKVKIQLSSPSFGGIKADNETVQVGGVTKKQATANAEQYAKDFPGDIEKKGRYAGAPTYSFVANRFWEQRSTRVSCKPYGAFTIWIFGNPTTFQKEDYRKRGEVDNFQNTLERRHEDNYLHTDICKLEPRTIELDNQYYLPDIHRICEDVSQNVIGYTPTGYEYPHIYKYPTIESIELNQDILVPYDGVSVQAELVAFLLSPDGTDYLFKTGIRRLTLFENYEHPGYSLELNYGKQGNAKVYPKTKHGIRVEAALYGENHLRKHFKRKSLEDLNRVKNEISKPLLNKLNIFLLA